MRLRQTDERQGDNDRRAVQRIPLRAQIALLAGGAALFYVGASEHGDCGCSKAIWVMIGGGSAMALGFGLLVQ